MYLILLSFRYMSYLQLCTLAGPCSLLFVWLPRGGGLRREGAEFGSAGADYDSGMDVMYGTAQGTAVSIL